MFTNPAAARGVHKLINENGDVQVLFRLSSRGKRCTFYLNPRNGQHLDLSEVEYDHPQNSSLPTTISYLTR